MRKDIIELYEPFYQFVGDTSDSPKWRELRDLVDELIEKIDRPKGKWIEEKKHFQDSATSILFYSNYKCSNCGEEPYFDNIYEYNFCPYCGAEMRGEE